MVLKFVAIRRLEMANPEAVSKLKNFIHEQVNFSEIGFKPPFYYFAIIGLDF